MKISEVIDKNYKKLLSKCNPDKVICFGKTEEDILNDVVITTLRKFKEQDIDPQEGADYLERTFEAERFFIWKRKPKDKLIFNGDY